MCSIRGIQPNLLAVTTQSNRIIPLIVMDISHNQCFYFISSEDAAFFMNQVYG